VAIAVVAEDHVWWSKVHTQIDANTTRRRWATQFHQTPDASQPTPQVLDMIGAIYGVERRAKKLTHEERLAMRQNESLPLLDRVFDWCRDNRVKYDLPTDLLGKAIQYAINQETYLRVYANDGRLEIDNNAAERILRLIAIGRKNWLFYGSAGGGKTGAILHFILASAKRNAINEYEYFLDVINRLADLPKQAEIFNLLPDRWNAKNPPLTILTP